MKFFQKNVAQIEKNMSKNEFWQKNKFCPNFIFCDFYLFFAWFLSFYFYHFLRIIIFLRCCISIFSCFFIFNISFLPFFIIFFRNIFLLGFLIFSSNDVEKNSVSYFFLVFFLPENLIIPITYHQILHLIFVD